MKLLVKGGRVIDPLNRLDGILDVLVDKGRIVRVESDLAAAGAKEVDARGKIVCPGFMDIHVHLREPGFEYKEDITTGSRAAVVGGFTTICCMPNTDPVIDNAAVAGFVRERAQKTGLLHVLPIGSITKKQAGEELSEMAELAAAGCVAVSDDGRPVMKTNIMRNGLDYARMFALPVLSHCEDLNLSGAGQMHEGFFSTLYGLKGIPAAAEEVMVARDIILSGMTGSRLHICHLSTRGSLELVRRAKAEGIAVTCEVTPHHLTLTDEIVGDYDTDSKVSPPLRSGEDVAALREALVEGVIDCIATDHAPHHREGKDCEYNLAASGISGLETAVAVIMDRLVHPGILPLEKMVSLFTVGPAEVLGLENGTLSPGSAADITILDPEEVRRVEPARFYSRGKNTPFKGLELKGWPWMTIVEGQIKACAGRIL